MDLVVHVRVVERWVADGVLLELSWMALVVVVVATVWLRHAVHAVVLEATTKLVPVNGWLTVEVSTSVVHRLNAVAWHHAVFHGWESLLVSRDLHGDSELLASLKVRLDVLSIIILEDYLWLLVLCHVS